jgi:hypothetical protein
MLDGSEETERELLEDALAAVGATDHHRERVDASWRDAPFEPLAELLDEPWSSSGADEPATEPTRQQLHRLHQQQQYQQAHREEQQR